MYGAQMFLTRPLVTLFLALSPLLQINSSGQTLAGRELVRPSLVADVTAVTVGKPFTVGIRLKIAPGWHTYWQFSGDAGAPVTVAWELPAGFSAGPLQWPIPHSRMDEGDLLSYVYESEVLLLTEITPSATPPSAPVLLKANLRWLVCEKTCIPGQGVAQLELATQGTPEPANAELFAAYRAMLPKKVGAPFEVKWDLRPEAVVLHVIGLPKEFDAEFFPIPPNAETKPDHPKISAVAPDGSRTITVPISEGNPPGLPWSGVLVTSKDEAPKEGWAISSADGAKSSAQPQIANDKIAASPAKPKLFGILWAAFLGGLILNLMPCVLPVIALKIFGFIAQASEEPRKIARLGMAFVAGVFAFFFGIAALAVGLKAAGGGLTWGFQFQNPYLLTGLIALVFVFALSMFGIFEVTLGGDAATQMDKLARKDGYGGAFLHGLFTTLLGTSCTAPLLGPVLGLALVQSTAGIFAIFAAIAAGMSLPYLLLTSNPAWMRYIPKPGAWMERVKQLMAFILLSVVVWLLSVLGQSRGVEALTGVVWFLLALGIASWLFGSWRKSALAWALAAAIAAGGWFLFVQGKLLKPIPAADGKLASAGGIAWKVFSPDKVEAAVKAGQPVFIDFTAEWCLNCKYNEKAVLETDPVRAAILAKNILPLKADWTNADPEITAWLKKFGRIGVPLYVVYPGSDKPPVVLPEILTQSGLLQTFNDIRVE